MELITLSQRICGQADEALRRQIDLETDPLMAIMRAANEYGNAWGVSLTARDNSGVPQTVCVPWNHVMQALKQAMFEQRAPKLRQRAIDTFAERVHALPKPTTT